MIFKLFNLLVRTIQKKYLDFIWNKMRFKNIEKLKKMMLANAVMMNDCIWII